MNGGELCISTGVLVDAVDALSSSIAVVVLFTFRHLIIVTSLYASPIRHDTLIGLTFVVGRFSTETDSLGGGSISKSVSLGHLAMDHLLGSGIALRFLGLCHPRQ